MKIPIVLLLSFSFLLSSCLREYFDHIDQNERQITYSTRTGSIDASLSTLPDAGVLRDLVTKIEGAEKRLWITLYTWTERETLEAAIRAKKRGVDVRVILEGNVYRTPRINDPTKEKLENALIPVVFSDERHHTFNHIKMWIIDEEWCISTGNWSYTSFTKNREFIACSQDPDIRSNLEEIFVADHRGAHPLFSGGLDTRIALSPENTRIWLEKVIGRARSSILFYNQAVTDYEIITLLEEKARAGLRVEVCQAYQKDESEEFLSERNPSPLLWKFSKKPYLHAKVVIIDNDSLTLGSTNITKNALENNREVLISLGSQKEMIETISTLYHKDCNSLDKTE